MRDQRCRESLDRDLPAAGEDGSPAAGGGALAHEDLVGGRRLLQTGRGAGGLARHGQVGSPGLGKDLARLDADPELQSITALADPLDQRERGGDGAIGVVAVHLRDAEHGHGGVADELLDAASVLLERGPREVEKRLEGPADVLRIAPVDQLGGADDVREHDRRELPLPAPAGVDGSAAGGAEPRFV
jgi:hypothetical protein